MSNDRPVEEPRHREADDRSGMERRLTDDDRRRLDTDDARRGSGVDAEGDTTRARDERNARGERDGRDGRADGREVRADRDAREGREGRRATGVGAPVAGGAVAAGAVGTGAGRTAIVPGAARGRLHVGINWGAAFFGWVTAMGFAVILTAFVAAIGAAVGVTRGATTAQQAADQIQANSQTVGLAGVIILAVVAFVSYYAGGYVAARMSRFDGGRQGFAVWLWAIIVAVVVAILAAVAGARYDVLSTLNTFPRIPVNQGDLTSTGIIALLVLLAITLLGAITGGAGGMRYHRKLETAEAELLDERIVEAEER